MVVSLMVVTLNSIDIFCLLCKTMAKHLVEDSM